MLNVNFDGRDEAKEFLKAIRSGRECLMARADLALQEGDERERERCCEASGTLWNLDMRISWAIKTETKPEAEDG